MGDVNSGRVIGGSQDLCLLFLLAVRVVWATFYVCPEVATLGVGLSHNTSRSLCQKCVGPEQAHMLMLLFSFSFSGPTLYTYCISVLLLELCWALGPHSVPATILVPNSSRISLCSSPCSLVHLTPFSWAPDHAPLPHLHTSLFRPYFLTSFSLTFGYFHAVSGPLSWGYVLLSDSFVKL